MSQDLLMDPDYVRDMMEEAEAARKEERRMLELEGSATTCPDCGCQATWRDGLIICDCRACGFVG